MSTLLLRLASPLQSWGVDSKFNRRETEKFPTKSGVIGMMAAALGRKRDEGIDDLRKLRFGVRIDQEGSLMRDFHMVHEEAFWRKGEVKYSHLTNRYYLSDAIFLVGLEGEPNFLQCLEQAIRNPVFPLFLGRRSCPPEGKLSLGIREGLDLLTALQNEPWIGQEHAGRWQASVISLQIVTDATSIDRESYFQRDDPVAFHHDHRQFAFRSVLNQQSCPVLNPFSRLKEEVLNTDHDPFNELD
jgi:CRISPR system Cascade subunit CasD